MIILKSREEIAKMRESGKVTAAVLREVGKKVKPGVTTLELDKFAHDFILRHKGIPTFLGYRGFPGTLCTSVNEQVVHGIPDKRVLKEGDIISVDVGVTLGGYVGDAARTYPVGKVSEDAKRLMQVTREGLNLGIQQACPGKHLNDIGHAVQSHVESHGFSVVRDFVGHGIGQNMHESPQVPNFGEAGGGLLLKAGMTLAIEPMVNGGDWKVKVLSDGWTVVTADGSLSAHFEETVAITDGKPEILTEGQ